MTHPTILGKVGEGVFREVDLAHNVHAAATLDEHGPRDRLEDRQHRESFFFRCFTNDTQNTNKYSKGVSTGEVSRLALLQLAKCVPAI